MIPSTSIRELTGVARDWEDFCEEAREMELYQALDWLA